MAKPSANEKVSDNHARIDPDAHGQAALLLVESLIHELVGRGLLSIEDAIAVTTDAADVKEEIILQATESDETAHHSLRLIARIADTLKTDRKLPTDRLDGEVSGEPR